MANSETFSGDSTVVTGNPTKASDYATLGNNTDYLEEALATVMSPSAADGRLIPIVTEAAAAATKVMIDSRWDPASGTAADNQTVRWRVQMDDDATPTPNQTVVGFLDWVMTDVSDTTEDLRLDIGVITAGTLAAEVSLTGAALYPATNDGLALGIANTGEWSDLRLASGAVIGWVNNAMTLTHSTGVLAFAGGKTTFNSSFTATSNIGVDISPSMAPSGASNDFALQMLPAVTLDNAGAFYGIYHRFPTVSSGKTLASARCYHVADAAGAGTITTKYAFFNDALTGTAYSFYNGGGIFFSASGYRVGTDADTHKIDDASNGGSSSTLYIGNAAITVASDVRAKLGVEDWQGDPMALVMRARPISFLYDRVAISDESRWGPSSRGRYIGLRAQEVIEWAPWAVNAGNAVHCPTCRAGLPCDEHRHLWQTEYAHLVPLLFAAIQRQQQQIDSLTGAN